jgi:nucleoside-diphosphate-sugar epimerase
MRVLLAGASGTLGRALVPQLIAAGHVVIGITRGSAGADRLRAMGADPVIADVLDRDRLLAALEGRSADAVLHELTDLTRPPLRFSGMDGTNRLRETGTAHLIDAARAVGATRMLTQSIVFGYGFDHRDRAVLDETAPFGEPEHTRFDPTTAALRSTEQQVFAADGIEGIALRYGLFYGLDAGMIGPMVRRRMLPVADHDGLIPYVHHEDAASATVSALTNGVAGSAYDIADSGSSWRHYVEVGARAFGAPRPLVLPKGLLRLAMPYAAQLMTRMDLSVSSERAARDLGWSPRYPSVDEGWPASAG